MHANTQTVQQWGGKKKPTKNSAIIAAITPSIGPPLFTSHLITDESCFRCSQEFLNWTLTSSYTCFSEHKQPRRNKHFSASYVFQFFYQWRENNRRHLCVKTQNLFNHLFLLFLPFIPPLLSSPSSLPPSHGLRELLAIWMLALYCEHSLIASVLPTASRASQHGAPAVCLICHCSVDIHCEKKTAEKWREWLRERNRRETEREREHL